MTAHLGMKGLAASCILSLSFLWILVIIAADGGAWSTGSIGVDIGENMTLITTSFQFYLSGYSVTSNGNSFHVMYSEALATGHPQPSQTVDITHMMHAGRFTTVFIAFAIVMLLQSVLLHSLIWPFKVTPQFHKFAFPVASLAMVFLVMATLLWYLLGHVCAKHFIVDWPVDGSVVSKRTPYTSTGWCWNLLLACCIIGSVVDMTFIKRMNTVAAMGDVDFNDDGEQFNDGTDNKTSASYQSADL
mmetsp:Transcript_42812/g.83931  ORF Transcript_42812/g.83931 Transcript_42812/m.83931 type:complete len:245 (+) Transcript_42812:30-764(+)|eukprot:CAMPEP_0175139466 /NCGR_PEP_ID=MMETSP0087-20121206/10917_1 /TAXON_ID=136419 /ORGANISM="Unknown Unknown, Strain D1" /LENGTH=244 /DNA_ID=CAMNT_0016422477 /DNA_START=47 /DNA_END=781 /DNA_ORIENTATION=+